MPFLFSKRVSMKKKKRGRGLTLLYLEEEKQTRRLTKVFDSVN